MISSVILILMLKVDGQDSFAIIDKFKNLLERADTKLRGEKAPALNVAKLLDLVKEVRETRGKELYYDIDTDSLITRKYTKAEKKLFGIGKETRTPNLFNISVGILFFSFSYLLSCTITFLGSLYGCFPADRPIHQLFKPSRLPLPVTLWCCGCKAFPAIR